MSISRRQALLTISQLAAAAALAGCGRSTQGTSTDQDDLELLASVAYDILGFPELSPALYVQAARQIQTAGGADVTAAIVTLRQAAAGGTWKDLDEARRIEVLQSMQDSPFFRTLRGTTLQVVLRDPAAQAIVGYGGSAIEKGGYLHHGFDDIAWLPAAKKN